MSTVWFVVAKCASGIQCYDGDDNHMFLSIVRSISFQAIIILLKMHMGKCVTVNVLYCFQNSNMYAIDYCD